MLLTANLPYNPLHWNVVIATVSRRAGTVYTVFGNDRAVAYARGGAEGNYPVGAVLSVVTWTQRPDPHWFGGMIPGAVKSVEFVSVVYYLCPSHRFIIWGKLPVWPLTSAAHMIKIPAINRSQVRPSGRV